MFHASHVVNKSSHIMALRLRSVESWVRIKKYYGIRFDRRSQNFGFHMVVGSQTISIAGNRRRSQTIAEDRTWFYLLRSSAIVCDHDRRIADDRRSVFPYDRRRSQNFLRSAICKFGTFTRLFPSSLILTQNQWIFSKVQKRLE